MKVPGGYLLWTVVLLVLLILVALAFVPQINAMLTESQEKVLINDSDIVSPYMEGEETPNFKYIGIDPSDSPETMIYKLFSNFDPSFIRTTNGDTVYYNAFVMDLKGNSYDVFNSNNDFIKELKNGIRDFSALDSLYQISSSGDPNCGSVTYSGLINYNNDCWHSSLDSKPNGCEIYANAALSGKAKIKVVWYMGAMDNNKRIVDVLVLLCDG